MGEGIGENVKSNFTNQRKPEKFEGKRRIFLGKERLSGNEKRKKEENEKLNKKKREIKRLIY